MSTHQELIAKKEQLAREIAAIDQQLADARVAESQEAIAKVKALLAQYLLTFADLVGSAAPRASKQAKPARKVAAKYRDSTTCATWSGRGLKPRWMTAALAAGVKVQDFAI